MKILVNQELNKEKWLSLLKKSKNTSPFQTPKVFDFFNSLNGFNADVFAISDNLEYKVLAIIITQKENGIKGFFSRRGILYGGPVILESEDNHLFQFLEGIKKHYKRKIIYLEIRNLFDYNPYLHQFKRSGFNYIPWLNFHLECDDYGLMKQKISKSRRRQINKSLKSNAHWKEAESLGDIHNFYIILSNLYKNKVKKPLPPIDFFLEFYKRKIGKYLLVYYDDKVIGGIMCLITPKKAIYEFYVCGLDVEYKNQYPSILSTWAAMEYANQNDIYYFDFMGAGKPTEHYGVREFKSRFGGREVENGRFIKVFNPFLYRFGELGLKILYR